MTDRGPDGTVPAHEEAVRAFLAWLGFWAQLGGLAALAIAACFLASKGPQPGSYPLGLTGAGAAIVGIFMRVTYQQDARRPPDASAPQSRRKWEKLALAFLLAEIGLFLVFLLLKAGGAVKDFKGFGGITPFLVTGGFVVTVIQLLNARNDRQADAADARSAFVKDYMVQFFQNIELSKTWHDLIESYFDEIYEPIAKAVREGRPPMPRPDGHPTWHPETFQGSDEERRVDALFGYLDILGYYWAKDLANVEDIESILGYTIGIINSRQVTKDYFKLIDDGWERWRELGWPPPPTRIKPFSYLDELRRKLEQRNVRP